MIRRWFAHRFLTRTSYRQDPFGRPQCWHVERPDWWELGARSGVTDITPKVARKRLDEWQDEMFARRKSA